MAQIILRYLFRLSETQLMSLSFFSFHKGYCEVEQEPIPGTGGKGSKQFPALTIRSQVELSIIR